MPNSTLERIKIGLDNGHITVEDGYWMFERLPQQGPQQDDDAVALLAVQGAEPKATDIELWRDFYRALLWMVNDYIGVCGISDDFTKVDARLGYAHEGYHNARRIISEHKPPMPERLRRFNDETACLTGGNQHPDRCVCQEKETGPFAGTPHKHYDEPPYSCARCNCKAYQPATLGASRPSPADLEAEVWARLRSKADTPGLKLLIEQLWTAFQGFGPSPDQEEK